jgi:putative ABC transport system permease protein
VQSFARLRAVDPGFTAAGRLVVNVHPARNFSKPADAQAWSDEMLRRIGTASGVDKAGGAYTFPLGQDRDTTIGIEFKGEHTDNSRMRSARARVVTAGFLETIGVRLVSGRMFTVDDRPTTLPVALVSRAFVRQHLGGRDPLGMQFAYGFPTVDPKTMRTIVGVVEDVRYASLALPPEPIFYTVQRQLPYPFLRGAVAVLPKAGSPEGLIPSIREALKQFDPQMTADFQTASAVVAATTSRQALGMTLLLIFGTTALVLAAVGIYGVIAYASAQRLGEIATRLALGATPGQVFWLLMRRGQWLALAGVCIGLGAAYAVGRAAASLVYGLRASDPFVLATATFVVVAIAWVATAIPANRASRTDPILALRGE